MTDFLNPHRISANYPIVNRAGEIQTGRIDVPPGFDSVRPTVKESLTTALDENGLARCGCGGKATLMTMEGLVVGVVCGECAVGTAVDQDAVNIWNRAMGEGV